MRTYLGSVLRKPENVLILRDIYFEGLKEGHKFKVAQNATMNLIDHSNDLAYLNMPDAYLNKHNTCINFGDFVGADVAQTDAVLAGLDEADAQYVRVQLKEMGIFTDQYELKCPDPDADLEFPARLYRGTTYKKDTEEIFRHNTGHMGCLDDYRSTARLFGATSHVYSSNPDPRKDWGR